MRIFLDKTPFCTIPPIDKNTEGMNHAKKIGENAFSGCEKLTRILVDSHTELQRLKKLLPRNFHQHLTIQFKSKNSNRRSTPMGGHSSTTASTIMHTVFTTKLAPSDNPNARPGTNKRKRQ